MALNRINPDGMYTPNNGIYSQVVTSTGTTTVHIAGTVPFAMQLEPMQHG